MPRKIKQGSLSFGYDNLGVNPLSGLENGIAAEKFGFDVLWVPDHFVDLDGGRVEPWSILAAVGARTKRIRLASGVTDTQRSHPSRTAHSVACLDCLSAGRAILGIGAGEAMNVVPFGLPWDEPGKRVKRLEEAVRVIKLLWGSKRSAHCSFSGEFYHLKDAFLTQSPLQQPHPPIFIGSIGGRKALEVAGRCGEGWFGWINTPEILRKRLGIISGAAIKAGRDMRGFGVATMMMVAFPRNSSEKKAAMLSAKSTLLVERYALASMGHEVDQDILQYQNFTVSREYAQKVEKASIEIPDEYVHRTAAIGEPEEAREMVDELHRAGANHIAVANLLSPKGVGRLMECSKRLMKYYR